MVDFVAAPDEGEDQKSMAKPLSGVGFVAAPEPHPVATVNAQDAASGNPDEYAKAKKIAERLALPIPVVQSDLPSYDSEQKVLDMQARMVRDPFYAQQMRDPNFAKLSSGDEDNLGGIQQAVSVLGRTAGQLLVGGPTQIGAQLLDVSAAFYDVVAPLAAATTLTDGLALDRQARATRRMAEDARKAATFFFGGREDESPLVGAALGGVQSASAMLMLAPVALKMAVEKTAFQAANYIADAMATGVGAQAYTQAREKGQGVLGATTYAVPHAGFEYIFERTPVGVFLEGMTGKSGLLAFTWNMVKAEVPNEQYTTLFQDFNEWVRLNPERTLRQYLEERPSAAAQTLVATLVGAGVQTGVARGVQKAVDFAHGVEDGANQDAAALQALLDYANQSALAKRDVLTFTQFVNDAAAQGPVDSVYIDAATFAQAAQEAGVDLKTTMPETAAALDEAVATKSDVRIPLGEFAANSTLFQPEIVQHLKTDLNGATQAQIADAEWVKETKDATEKALAAQEFTDAIKQSGEAVKNELKAQLDAANRFTPEVNDAYAGFMSAFYSTQAARLGITPEEMYVKYPLRVQAQNFEGANVLSQPTTGSQINVGHNIGDTVNAVNPDELVKAIEALGVGVVSHKQFQSETSSKELTSIITTDRELTSDEVHNLSAQFGQRAIAHLRLRTGVGELQGPDRQGWINEFGDFNPEFYYPEPGLTLAASRAGGSTLYQPVSTRTPTSKAGREDPHLSTGLEVGLEALDEAPNFKEKLAGIFGGYNSLRRAGGTVDEQINSYVEQMKDNLLWLFDQVPAEIRQRSKMWYEGGRNIADSWVDRYNGRYTDAQMAGSLAVMSPKMPWDTNVSLSERIIDAYTDQQNTPWSKEMGKTAKLILSRNPGLRKPLAEVKGKTLAELDTPYLKGVWIRVYDESHNSRSYRLLTPEGGYSDFARTNAGREAIAAWGNGFDPIAKVVSILEDGRMSNISRNLGNAHKVRNFYNNLYDPREDRSVTIDTHAVAAALLKPLGASAPEVNDALGGAGSHDATGLSGTYAVFAEAYRRAAAERGVLPREMQSITWEAGRGLFSSAFKTAYAKNKTLFDNLWMGYNNGHGNIDEIRTAILAAAGGITAPRWVESGAGLHEGAWASSYKGDVRGPQRGGRNDAGTRTADTRRTLRQSAVKLPEYGQDVPGSISVVGVHFSKEARPIISSAYVGTGMKGAEASRRSNAEDRRLRHAINFYVNQGNGVHPEAQVGNVPHAVRLNGLYDMDADRLNLRRQGKEDAARARVERKGQYPLEDAYKFDEMNFVESAILNHGFAGLFTREFANGQGAAVLLGQHAVQAKVIDSTKAITEVPPPRDVTPERALAEALMAVPGLPGGQMSGPDWISTLWKAAPQIAENIPEHALAAIEAHTDLMYRDEVARTFYQVPPEVVAFLAGSAVQQVVYHGTRPGNNIAKFNVPALDGVYFTPDAAYANGFTNELFTNTGAAGSIYPSYVSIKKPYTVTAEYGTPEWNKVVEHGLDVLALRKDGYDGVILREPNGNVDQVIVFGENQIMSALSGQMMQGETAPRGQISFGANLQATPSVLTLLANADLSTFLHESGHFYLEVLNDMAAQPDAPQAIKDDFAKVLAWFGVKDAAAWNAMSLEAKRPFHEQFARGFEAYLFEGKAPSEQMQSTFQKFRSWLVNVYQQIKALDVALTDEVRSVFDRLVATNDEILQAETARTFAPLYETKPEGMTDAEWADYHVLGGDATREAVDQLQTRSLRDMQYASNAKAAALKRLQARANVLRKGVRAEVTAEVSAEPIYQVMRFLKTGVYEGENAGTYTTHRLDIATLDAMYPEDMADRPPLLNLAQMRGHDGIAPDVVAQMFGYGSGDALVRELLRTEPMRNKIDGLTDQRMLERYGDIADPASMEKAANAAVHNEVRAKFVATELRTLEKAAGNKQTLAAMAREFAATLIARKRIRTIRPAIYAAAAAKAAKNADTAFRKDDVATAAGEKRNQLVNVYAARFAHEATDEVEKSVAYLKRVGESKAVDPEYRAQIAGLLERFDLRKVSQREVASRQSLLQWMEAQRQPENGGLEPAIAPELVNEALRKPYQEMTLEEFRGLVDSIKNIEHLGRLKSKLLKLADQRAFAVIVKDVADNIHHYAKRTLPHTSNLDMSGRKQILALHTKMSSFMRQLDGWKDNGIMQRLFIHSSNAAGAQEALMHEAATIKLVALFESLLANESLKQKAGRAVTPFGLYHGYMGEKLFIPEINEALSREARIMVALNVGNEGNLQRLMDGDNWTDKQVQAVVDTLTKPEMDFVQSVWNFIAGYKSSIGEQQKRLTGVEPTWIEARQVVTKHGVYAGGYLPAKYNGAMSSRSLSDEAAANLTDALRATRGSAAARASFTKERAAKVVNRPLRKDFGVITQHVTEVTHRLAWQEWLVDVNRILRANPVDQAIREHYGPEMLESIRENIEAIAAGNVGAQNALERGVNYLRTGATIAGLGWRLTTSLLQPIGLTQSMVRIGPKWVGKGLVEFLGDAAHMENSFAKIAAKSEMMRLRAKTMQREISEIQDQVTGEGGAIKASFFYLIQKMQLVADIPTWLGAYHKAIATNGLQDPGAIEANAIAQADQAVLDAQGAGQVKDLPAVLRGTPYLKLWTNFASFFIGTTFQLTREAVGRTDFKSPAGVLALAVDFVLLYSLPAALGTMMKYALSDDDDEGKLLRTLISDQLSYMLGTMIGLRELGSAARAAVGLPGDYGGPAGGRVLGEITRLGKQVQQGEADEAFWKALNNASGVIFHYPAGQINSTADGVAALAEGKTVNPGVLAVGSSKR